MTRSRLLSRVLSCFKPNAILNCSLDALIGEKEDDGGSVTTGGSIGGAMMGDGNISIDGVWIVFLKRWNSQRFYAKFFFSDDYLEWYQFHINPQGQTAGYKGKKDRIYY